MIIGMGDIIFYMDMSSNVITIITGDKIDFHWLTATVYCNF